MEGADQATVSGYVALDRSTTGNVLARLEKRGLVKRKPSSKDRRFKVLYLTRKGRKVVEEVKEAVDRVQEQLLEPLSAKEKISFKKCLRKVTDYHNENSRAPLTLLKLARQVDSS
jgi:DNA-binding MarR family transcriptional regulator